MLTDIERSILTELAAREAAIAARPEPPAYRSWDRHNWQLDREHGPRYSPSWFGEGASTEAGRQRHYRAVRRLGGLGLLEEVVTPGGRLVRLKSTPAGREAFRLSRRIV